MELTTDPVGYYRQQVQLVLVPTLSPRLGKPSDVFPKEGDWETKRSQDAKDYGTNIESTVISLLLHELNRAVRHSKGDDASSEAENDQSSIAAGGIAVNGICERRNDNADKAKELGVECDCNGRPVPVFRMLTGPPEDDGADDGYHKG